MPPLDILLDLAFSFLSSFFRFLLSPFSSLPFPSSHLSPVPPPHPHPLLQSIMTLVRLGDQSSQAINGGTTKGHILNGLKHTTLKISRKENKKSNP